MSDRIIKEINFFGDVSEYDQKIKLKFNYRFVGYLDNRDRLDH